MLAKGKGLQIPKPKVVSSSMQGKNIATYKSCKEDRLHSLNLAPDCENFISADDNRIDLWNIEKTNCSVYNLIDYERRNSNQEEERINSAVFNPTGGSVFMYTTSEGKINVCDLRESSDFHTRPSLQFQAKNSANSWNAKELYSVSEAKFVPNSSFIASRDYMGVKLWDLRTASSLCK